MLWPPWWGGADAQQGHRQPPTHSQTRTNEHNTTKQQQNNDSPRGPISSHWKREGDTIVMDVMIPANTTARVHVPARAVADVTEGGRPVAPRGIPGVTMIGVEDGAVVLDVGSGTYRFVATQ